MYNLSIDQLNQLGLQAKRNQSTQLNSNFLKNSPTMPTLNSPGVVSNNQAPFTPNTFSSTEQTINKKQQGQQNVAGLTSMAGNFGGMLMGIGGSMLNNMKGVSEQQTLDYNAYQNDLTNSMQGIDRGGMLQLLMYGGKPKKYPTGGLTTDGMPTPAQLEKKEQIVDSTGNIFLSKSDKLHKNMKSDEITDMLPAESYVISNRIMLKKDKADKIILGIDPITYKESTDKTKYKEIKLGDIFTKNEQSLAELADILKKKYPTELSEEQKGNIFAIKTMNENKASRSLLLGKLIELNEEGKSKKSGNSQIPQFPYGGGPGPKGKNLMKMLKQLEKFNGGMSTMSADESNFINGMSRGVNPKQWNDITMPKTNGRTWIGQDSGLDEPGSWAPRTPAEWAEYQKPQLQEPGNWFPRNKQEWDIYQQNPVENLPARMPDYNKMLESMQINNKNTGVNPLSQLDRAKSFNLSKSDEAHMRQMLKPNSKNKETIKTNGTINRLLEQNKQSKIESKIQPGFDIAPNITQNPFDINNDTFGRMKQGNSGVQNLPYKVPRTPQEWNDANNASQTLPSYFDPKDKSNKLQLLPNGGYQGGFPTNYIQNLIKSSAPATTLPFQQEYPNDQILNLRGNIPKNYPTYGVTPGLYPEDGITDFGLPKWFTGEDANNRPMENPKPRNYNYGKEISDNTNPNTNPNTPINYVPNQGFGVAFNAMGKGMQNQWIPKATTPTTPGTGEYQGLIDYTNKQMAGLDGDFNRNARDNNNAFLSNAGGVLGGTLSSLSGLIAQNPRVDSANLKVADMPRSMDKSYFDYVANQNNKAINTVANAALSNTSDYSKAMNYISATGAKAIEANSALGAQAAQMNLGLESQYQQGRNQTLNQQAMMDVNAKNETSKFVNNLISQSASLGTNAINNISAINNQRINYNAKNRSEKTGRYSQLLNQLMMLKQLNKGMPISFGAATTN